MEASVIPFELLDAQCNLIRNAHIPWNVLVPIFEFNNRERLIMSMVLSLRMR